MAVSIKSAREIELMREAGKRLAHVHQELEAMIAPGISTWELMQREKNSSETADVSRIFSIIMDILLLSVFPSMTKSCMESRERTVI